MVPVDQPAGPLVRVLLDPHVPMEANFFREEREYLERGKGIAALRDDQLVAAALLRRRRLLEQRPPDVGMQ